MKVTLVLVNGSSFQSGKDTACDLIAKHIKANTENVNVYCNRFADKLKEWAEQMTGIQREIQPYEHYNDVVSDFTHDQKNIFCSLWDMTLGQLLQKFATEGCRDGFDPQIWCKLLSVEIATQITYLRSQVTRPGHRPEHAVFLIPDFRFINEENLLRFIDLPEVEQFTMQISRPQTEVKDDSRDLGHRSETELTSKSVWHFTVVNDGTLDELEDQCSKIADWIVRPEEDRVYTS